ncbi:MAG: 16S rRNA (guanine(527)-N(7))-methyltransferase RsmG [Mycoplasma sp.]
MTRLEFEQIVKQNFPYANDSFFLSIEKYKELLNSENKKYNLTRLNSDDIVYEKYFFASLIPFINIDLTDKYILDIGSGSGIPGILLKILNPSIKLSIIEANLKKINFMKILCEELNLDGVEFFYQRSEDVKNTLVEKFDIVTSRAVSSLPILLEISSQYTKIGGIILEPKSSNSDEEFSLGLKHSKKLNLEFIQNIDFSFANCNYRTMFFKKVDITPNEYPRIWKEIIKEFKNV